jgi:hypothetical protein
MKKRNPRVQTARIRRLLAVGCPIPTDNPFNPPPGLVVEVRNPERTRAFDFRASTEYIFDVRISNNSYAPLKIENLKCRSPWKDSNFTWLGDARRYAPQRKTYRMPGGRRIPYESVLNHCIGERTLEPGESLEGTLLAWSIFTRIPEEYLHDETCRVRIALLDHYGRSHVSIVEVQVDRSATMRPPKITKRFGQELYGGGQHSVSTARIPEKGVLKQWPTASIQFEESLKRE